MLVSILGWLACAVGLLGTWLVPRTRHGWLLAITCGVLWIVVDGLIDLWSGLVAGVFALAANWRCWRRKVTAQKQG